KIIFFIFLVYFWPWAFAEPAVSPSPWLRFDLQPKQIERICRSAQDLTEGKLKEWTAISSSSRTFENTVFGLEAIVQEYVDAVNGLNFLSYVSTNSAVRDAAHECETKAGQYGVDLYSRHTLYAPLRAYASTTPALQEEDKKLLEKILLEFKRNGLELSSDRREKVKELKKQLVDTELAFGKNVRDYKDSLELPREQLVGLPEDYINRLQKSASGGTIVTLDYPDYFPFMENARDEHARKQLEFKFSNRASTTNVRLLEEALSLRQQIASLLGYPAHAHYVLEVRMAKKPDQVIDFLGRLQKKLKSKGAAELKERLELKRKDLGADRAERLYAWDWRYYNNQLKKLKYAIDQQQIKEYFPLETVLEGMLGVYQDLLGVRFLSVGSPASWHPDVQLHEVRDAASDELMGHFYMDLFPREGKYKHAAAFDIVKAHILPDSHYQKPVSAIVANFNKPTADKPSLLTHDEVETLFHEFGHIMHQVLTKAKYGRFSGTSVAQDFVEAPSQMLENWVWDPVVLRKLSGHYQDKSKKLPEELLKKMIEAKNMDSGIKYLRQIFFATLDMRYHTASNLDTTEVYSQLMEQVSLIPMSPGTHPQASFDHLMGGYDSGYYGYLWSEVYSADMFSKFERGGIMNPDLGRKYRELILEPGRSQDEAAQLKKFLGREPNEKAFIKSIGLK
ncbi:MAG: Zn-dependent oligopeptidase, partial [Elusimicrobia bacterium]|nr:Zn-dependent oligopeptidase [Elusimicrobiota bacterium]